MPTWQSMIFLGFSVVIYSWAASNKFLPFPPFTKTFMNLYLKTLDWHWENLEIIPVLCSKTLLCLLNINTRQLIHFSTFIRWIIHYKRIWNNMFLQKKAKIIGSHPEEKDLDSLAMSVNYGSTTWKKRVDMNYTWILCAILNKSWKQHPTKEWLYGHFPPI